MGQLRQAVAPVKTRTCEYGPIRSPSDVSCNSGVLGTFNYMLLLLNAISVDSQ